jgi:hypothetical protein
VLCSALLCCAVLRCAALCCAVLCCAVCAVLCCAVLCCAVLTYTLSSPGLLAIPAMRDPLPTPHPHLFRHRTPWRSVQLSVRAPGTALHASAAMRMPAVAFFLQVFSLLCGAGRGGVRSCLI